MLRRVLNLLLPTPCHVCGEFVQDGVTPWFCAACWKGIPMILGSTCLRCGKSYPSDVVLPFSYPCGSCQIKPPPFDQAVAVGYYEGSLAKVIQLFKYQKRTRLAAPLSQLMMNLLQSLPAVDLILPVPLHPSRLREREFNQSLLLADPVGRFLRRPVSTYHLLRTRHTPPQIGLSAQERTRNMRGAFTLSRSEELRGKTILLIDDVYTTGSTVQECARVLKKEGRVGEVFVGTLARTRHD